MTCLQEVHIKKRHQKILENSKLGKLYTSLTSKKNRGVAVYVKDWISSELKYADEDGRTVMIELVLENRKILLVVIYAPNQNQQDFLKKIHNKIIELDYEDICLIGDYNVIVDVGKDYEHHFLVHFSTVGCLIFVLCWVALLLPLSYLWLTPVVKHLQSHGRPLALIAMLFTSPSQTGIGQGNLWP